MSAEGATGLEVAVVGMSGRFPGASGVEELWENLRSGVESVRFSTAEELRAAGLEEAVIADPTFVRARAMLDGVELFDAAFFDVPPREAELTDPQHRLFLEHAWEALEHAGYGRRRPPARVGVYCGAGAGDYVRNLLSRPDLVAAAGEQMVWIGNRVDNLATRVAYKLDLRGPALSVQTACSTSLVAVHLACQALLNGECEMALAGGVSITLPHVPGYRWQEGNIFSPDGHCRPFDAAGAGIVSGNGLGIVVLKRLEDALADGDFVWAVIKGSAVANDGAARVGYVAPGVEGQVEAIRAAQVLAEVDPATISYVEAHGTGTRVGDPIEVTSLTEAFRTATTECGFCALGSIKSNLGHLDAAAGVAGLIKTVLALYHREIPPILHFTRPNPRIDFASTPFFVNTTLIPWEPRHGVRRAGVSSFGIGGTNAHVVVEEAPAPAPAAPGRPRELLLLSAKSEAALATAARRLQVHLTERPGLPLADVAFTLDRGREPFACRRALVARDVADAVAGLDPEAGRLLAGRAAEGRPEVVFLFPGQGSQYPGMGRELYEAEEVYRRELDRCARLLAPHLGRDLLELLHPPAERRQEAERQLAATWLTQPALFAVEWALARQWLAWGVEPAAMIGHSVGEYVAACLAGLFELSDALFLVAERGRLIQELPRGAMLAVPLGAQEVEPRLEGGLALAAINAPSAVVVAGPETEVEALAARLAAEGVTARRLNTSHAFHSAMMEPALPAFERALRRVRFEPPRQRWISNLTGDWIRPGEVMDPAYWVRHLRETVRFGPGTAGLLARGNQVFVEVGPGRALGSLVRRQAGAATPRVVASLPHAAEQATALEQFLAAAGGLWVAGVELDAGGFWAGQERRRLPLPTYPFERKRHWVEPARPAAMPGAGPPRPALAMETSPPGVPGSLAGAEATEAIIAGVWREILGVERIGRGDSFYDLGGDSLMATRVLSRLRALTGAEVPLADFLAAPTVGDLAAAVERLPRAAAEEPPIEPVSRGGALPLSYAQQRLWVLDQIRPGDPAYNMPAVFRLAGPFSPAALEASLTAILCRHEALRTCYELVAEEPRQRIVPLGSWRLSTIDLGALGADAAAAELRRLAGAEAARPFDLGRAPLIRAALVRLAPAEHALLLTVHHICGDGWSWGVLFGELVDLYRACREGRPSPLPPLPVQYADFAVWQRRRLDEQRLAAGLAYWRRQLAPPLPELILPADRPRVGRRSGAGAVRAATYPDAAVARLEALAREEGATPFMALFAAFLVLLHHRTGQEDLVVGTDVANRDRRELEGLIGFFVNQLALRVHLGGDPTFRELLRRVRATATAAYAHQDVPFERVVDAVQPERSREASPLFRVKLVLQNNPMPERGASEVRVSLLPAHTAAAKFELLVNLTRSPVALGAVAEYSTDLYEAATVDLLLRDYGLVLERAGELPDATLAELAAALADEVRERSRNRARELRQAVHGKLKETRRRGVVAGA